MRRRVDLYIVSSHSSGMVTARLAPRQNKAIVRVSQGNNCVRSRIPLLLEKRKIYRGKSLKAMMTIVVVHSRNQLASERCARLTLMEKRRAIDLKAVHAHLYSRQMCSRSRTTFCQSILQR